MTAKAAKIGRIGQVLLTKTQMQTFHTVWTKSGHFKFDVFSEWIYFLKSVGNG